MKLQEASDLYILRRQMAGEKFYGPASLLRSFCRRYGDKSLMSITATEVKEFLDGPRTGPATWRVKYGMLRVFFEYWRRRGDVKMLPMPPTAPKYTSSFLPYIFTKQELRSLLDAIPRCQQRPHCQMSAVTFRALLLFLYGTGMRVGEAVHLRMAQVDLDHGVITIRGTKFYKSRLVPLGRDVQQLLLDYVAIPGRRDRSDQHLFLSKSRAAIKRAVVERSFRRLRQLAGVHRNDDSSYQPRVHDLRHTFAVHRVTDWYRQGADVQSLLPALSTYLGHVDLASTQRYLTMTPDLLAEANRRYQQYVYGGCDER
jgi:site-specific recombinase XerD